MYNNLKNLIRALRLPFTGASVLPFIFGSFLARPDFSALSFLLGLMAVISTHLSANLMNDYADSKSGVDWKDRNFYKFFGGSKLIQEKVFSEKFYRNLAIFLSFLAGFSVIILAVRLRSIAIIGYYLLVLFLGWSYSAKPLQFSYHRVGELIILILFGPALVMGGYFIQTEIFPTREGFLLSLPFGLLTTAILYANEIPDFLDDREAGKFTWVGLVGQEKAFVLYYLLISFAFIAVVLSIFLGYLSRLSLFSLIFILPALKAAGVLKRCFPDKIKLLESSKLTIAAHTLVSLVLILDVFL